MTETTRGERILVVEDDLAIRRGVAMNLRAEGYAVLEAADGDTGLKTALEQAPDLLILDIMLPGMSGLDLLQVLRDSGVTIPVIILSARDRPHDKVEGLELGADDYVTKPFGVRELLARVRAHLRRAEQASGRGRSVQLGDVLVDRAARTAHRAGVEVPLTPKAYALLEHLIDTAGRAQSREQLLTRVWGWDYEGTPRTVDNFVRALRLALEPDPDDPTYIVTVRGIGYRLDLPKQR
jgi:two-component system, OmpR family, alkaline phosphatase synthesis response regulator PhoP